MGLGFKGLGFGVTCRVLGFRFKGLGSESSWSVAWRKSQMHAADTAGLVCQHRPPAVKNSEESIPRIPKHLSRSMPDMAGFTLRLCTHT